MMGRLVPSLLHGLPAHPPSQGLPQGLPVDRSRCVQVVSWGRPAARAQFGGLHRPLMGFFPLLLPQCNPPLEVKDLFVDIQDGKILMALLEVLSGRNLVRMSRKGQAGIKCKGKHCWRFALSTPLDIGTRTWPCVIL